MGMAMTLHEYLEEMEAEYNLVDHPHRETSLEIAKTAHVRADRLAKGVLMRDEQGILSLVVIPSDRRVDLASIDKLTQHHMGLATDHDVEQVFDDCDPGAIPPMGNAYALRVMLDRRLANQPEVFFEAGDHEELVRMSGDEFRRIMGGAMHGDFSRETGGIVDEGGI